MPILVAGVLLLAGCAEMRPRSLVVQSLDPAAANALAADPSVLIVDVSDANAFLGAHIPGAVSIPRDELRFRVHELPSASSLRVLVYDEQGRRAHSAAVLVRDETGDDVYVLAGGMREWKRAGLPTNGRTGASYVLR
jgi:rhodanese-related sulfurtransferase